MMQRLFVVVVILLTVFSTHIVSASTSPSILPPVKLKIDLTDLDTITLYFSESSFDSYKDAAELQSNGRQLVSAKKSIPLTKAKRLLSSLKDMYPSPEAVTILRWTDDYPYEQVTIKLKDDRQIVAMSSSQFPRGVPWNIRVWQGDPNKGGELLGSYVLLNYDFHAGASEIWKELTGDVFPRDYGFDQFYWSEDEKQPTIEFYVPRPYDGFESYGNQMGVQGKKPDTALSPFIPLLKQNDDLLQLLNGGYTLFDAAFDMTVDVKSLEPVSYSGMIALRAPDSPDVVVSTVTISGTEQFEIHTPLQVTTVEQAIARRKGFSSLQYLTDFIPGIVFIHDLRSTKSEDFIELECEKNRQYASSDYGILALLTQNNDQKLTFYHLPQKNSWTINGGFSREEGTWNDRVVEGVLQKWLPSSFSEILPEDMESLSLNIGFAFRSSVSHQKPELLPLLKKSLPSQSLIHSIHPQKEGDRFFTSLEGRVIIPEDKSDPQIVYCGHPRPDWYGPEYNVADVKIPDTHSERFNLKSKRDLKEGWTPLFELPDKNLEVTNSTLTSSEPGYLHLLWTIDKEGVFYSEGWADGTGWLTPQRLGDESWTLQAVSNSRGEIHLFWSTHYDPIGTMHLWRNSNGEWQDPEYWEGKGFFSNILLDETGSLHLAWSQSDGWDDEFFYAMWTRENGVSEPENISRRLGDIGNSTIILRLDSQQKLHAVWGHPFGEQQYIDPLSGEAFDTAGLFYSKRLGNNEWSLPEEIGTFAPFTGAMDFELTSNGTPVVVWQSLDGIVSSTRKLGQWTPAELLQRVVSPEEPDPFGPGRWVEATAEIKIAKDKTGLLQAIWINRQEGMFLSRYDDQTWSGLEQILSEQSLSNFSAQSGSDGSIQLIYFDARGQLYHLQLFGHENKKTHLSMAYDLYGVESAKMESDEAGFIYVLGLPRTPHWKAFIPGLGMSVIPTPIPTFTASPIPSKTSTPTVTPTFTETPVPSPTTIAFGTQISSSSASAGYLGLLLLSIAFLILLIRFALQKRFNQHK